MTVHFFLDISDVNLLIPFHSQTYATHTLLRLFICRDFLITNIVVPLIGKIQETILLLSFYCFLLCFDVFYKFLNNLKYFLRRDNNYLVFQLKRLWQCSQKVFEKQKKNPDALPDTGVREALLRRQGDDAFQY